MNGAIGSVIAALCEDESWQGNLTDPERARAIEWAEGMMTSMLESAKLMVRKRLRQLNIVLANQDVVDRGAVFEAILGE